MEVPGVPKKMFLSKKGAYLTKEHFFGTPCIAVLWTIYLVCSVRIKLSESGGPFGDEDVILFNSFDWSNFSLTIIFCWEIKNWYWRNYHVKMISLFFALDRSKRFKNGVLGTNPIWPKIAIWDLNPGTNFWHSWIYRWKWCFEILWHTDLQVLVWLLATLSIFWRLTFVKCLVNLSTLKLGIRSPIKDLNKGCTQEFLYCIGTEIYVYNLWSIVTSFLTFCVTLLSTP